jgi:hypothetical protein
MTARFEDFGSRCKDCLTTDPDFHYKNRKSYRCYDCERYRVLVERSKFPVEFDHSEFIAWKDSAPGRGRCVYCGINNRGLYALEITNPRGRRYESLGVDRIDREAPYTLDNIVPACGPCQSMRGSVLTHEEMLRLGPVLTAIWRERFLRLGYT